MSLAGVLADITARLTRAGVTSPGVDAEFLLAHVAKMGRGEVLAHVHQGFELTDGQAADLEELVLRRESREPLQHLLGVAPFMAFQVRVGPGVFVPRPETESLAERAIHTASTMAVGDSGLRIVDLCSGSGVLAIALARAIPHATVQALEISDDALPYLAHNIVDLAPEVVITHSSLESWASGVEPSSLDLIVSNPPYVPDAEIPNDPEVQNYDPRLALYGGEDGLDLIRVIAEAASRALRPGGVVMLEHSNLQGAAVREALENQGFRTVSTEQDLVGRDRFTQGYRP
jgi:release factor glutamine methyltransferase